MIALLDADILTYRIGYASNTENWNICRWRLDEFLENLLVFQLEVDDYEGWLTDGSNNFRNKIAKTLPYKGQRSAPKPVHYDALREYMQGEWGFKMETEQEADDAIGIRATELGDKGIICTIDKDLDNIPGKHFNFVKGTLYDVSVSAAIRNFYRQILTGDRIDNVQGLRGVGPVKADRILGEGSDPIELYERVVKAYDGDTERVVENGQLLWIRTKPGEIWKPPSPIEETT